jgi:hypothetical protein
MKLFKQFYESVGNLINQTHGSAPAPAPEDPNTIELKGNINLIAKTVINSILRSENQELEEKYVDFINVNGSYKPGREFDKNKLVNEVVIILGKEDSDPKKEKQEKIDELTSLREKLIINLGDIDFLQTDIDNILDLNKNEISAIQTAKTDINEKKTIIEEELKKLGATVTVPGAVAEAPVSPEPTAPPAIVSEAEAEVEPIIVPGIVETIDKIYKINFDITLKNSDGIELIYYEKPNITIDKLDRITDTTNFTEFNTIDDLSSLFKEKFKEKQPKTSEFRNTMHIFKNKYTKMMTGGSTYSLKINFDIYIYLKYGTDANGSLNSTVIVDKFYFNINNDNDKLKIDIDTNKSYTEQDYKNDNYFVFPKKENDNLNYTITLMNSLDPLVKKNIIMYLNELKEPAAAAVGGKANNKRTRKMKRDTKKRIKRNNGKKKFSNKKRSKVSRKMRY